LFAYLATFQCVGDYINCGGVNASQLCVNKHYMCGAKKDPCGNGWDLSPEACGQFVYHLIDVLSFNSPLLRIEFLPRDALCT